jgi:hypothetical protein
MIARADRTPFVLRLAAPLAWRNERRIAVKLLGFAATDEGSALDMLYASEQVQDPHLRRLFYRHGLDEARHARMFREVAHALDATAMPRNWEAKHAERQELLAQYGLVGFVAFVWLSESRARDQFMVLAKHFSAHPHLGPLFGRIGREEGQHVSYSRHLLDGFIADGREEEVRRALRKVRVSQAWMGWRRAGRRIGDGLASLLLGTVFCVVLPVFALAARFLTRRPGGWVQRTDEGQVGLEDLRRQF